MLTGENTVMGDTCIFLFFYNCQGKSLILTIYIRGWGDIFLVLFCEHLGNASVRSHAYGKYKLESAESFGIIRSEELDSKSCPLSDFLEYHLFQAVC